MSRFLKRWWWVALFLIGYSLAASIMAFNRWQQYEIFYFDHGIFDDALTRAARFQAPLIDHNEAKPLNQLGDHFTVLMYLLIPLYWLFPHTQILFVVQPLLVVVSVAILLKIAWRKLQSRWFIAALMVALTFFIGIQNALLGEFHADLMVLIPLACLLNALDQQKWRQFFFWSLMVLLGKESNSTILLALAVYLVIQKQWKVASMTALMAIGYTYAITRLVMPALAGRAYEYAGYIPSLNGIAERFFFPLIKTKTMFVSLATFGLLPLAAIGFLPVILQDWVVRFALNPVATRYDLGLHYNAVTTILLGYSAILGYQNLSKLNHQLLVKRLLPLAMVVVTLFFHRFIYHGPLGLVTNFAFYDHSQDFGFLDSLISSVPPHKTVMASNNLAAQLIRTNQVMLYRLDYQQYQPEVIIFDLRAGQGVNNFWPLSEAGVKQLYEKVSQDSSYQQQPTNSEQVIFIRR